MLAQLQSYENSHFYDFAYYSNYKFGMGHSACSACAWHVQSTVVVQKNVTKIIVWIFIMQFLKET